jgi:hypothetical protein
LEELSRTVPCLLCGRIHALKIHSYPQRKVRMPETCLNVAMVILVIRRDRVLDYLAHHPRGTVSYRKAITMLGALDQRTIRRHLAEGMQRIREATGVIAGLLAEKAFFATMPPRRLAHSEAEYLEAVSQELNRAGGRARGGGARKMPAILFVHLAGVFGRHRGVPAVSMTCVLRALVFHDTS